MIGFYQQRPVVSQGHGFRPNPQPSAAAAQLTSALLDGLRRSSSRGAARAATGQAKASHSITGKRALPCVEQRKAAALHHLLCALMPCKHEQCRRSAWPKPFSAVAAPPAHHNLPHPLSVLSHLSLYDMQTSLTPWGRQPSGCPVRKLPAWALHACATICCAHCRPI